MAGSIQLASNTVVTFFSLLLHQCMPSAFVRMSSTTPSAVVRGMGGGGSFIHLHNTTTDKRETGGGSGGDMQRRLKNSAELSPIYVNHAISYQVLPNPLICTHPCLPPPRPCLCPISSEVCATALRCHRPSLSLRAWVSMHSLDTEDMLRTPLI